MDEPPSARDAYSLSIIDPPRSRFWLSVIVNLVGRTMAFEDGGGGRRAVFRDRATDEVVAEFKEPWFAGTVPEFDVVIGDYGTMSADEFQRVWLAHPPPKSVFPSPTDFE